MVKCAKCSKLVGKKSPGVQCSKCNKWLHGTCASLSTEQLSALSLTDSIDWKCRGCSSAAGGKPKRISVILPDLEDEDSEVEGTNQGTQERLLHEIKKEVREMRQTVREIIRDELQSTLKFYSDKIDDFEDKMKDYDCRVKLMENQCKNANNKIANLELKNEVLQQKINKMEQAQFCNDIEICGVTEDEKDVKKLASLVSKIIQQKEEDIVKVYRKKKPIKPGVAQGARAMADAPIVVTLREGRRDSWLAAARSTSISAGDLGVSGDSKVFVRAALSPTTAYLLWRGKTDLKEKSLCKYVWCKDGLVMVRKNDGDKKVYYVRSANDIETIKKELLK
ncbi:hypothetical protein JYU34_012299 [Plutella xylostella]|uniref:PHD-type domain-containing protein n=1 Tax=Plutella xylostella TaxID=51655 RepID=A0ABQ7QET5_PLUXY|nr:hypothetical protein JYU34_012299 [Plutella xylostella]